MRFNLKVDIQTEWPQPSLCHCNKDWSKTCKKSLEFCLSASDWHQLYPCRCILILYDEILILMAQLFISVQEMLYWSGVESVTLTKVTSAWLTVLHDHSELGWSLPSCVSRRCIAPSTSVCCSSVTQCALKMWKSWRVKINTIKRHECIFQFWKSNQLC